MRFVTSAERIGEKRGEIRGEIRGATMELVEAIGDIVDIKFGEKGIFMMNRIKGIEDINQLRTIKAFIKNSSGLEEIIEMLDKSNLTLIS